jgi:bifunctional isochorismate lyase/aryl carrier protein
MQALTLEQLRSDVAHILNESVSEIGYDDNLTDFGLDSIRLMALAARWQQAGARVQFADLAERPQLSHWWSLIAQDPQ